MSYASDLGVDTVHDICPMTGYPRNQGGELLQTIDLDDGSVIAGWDTPGTVLPNFTSPYGYLCYAVGSDADFICFDSMQIDAGPRGLFVVLDAVVNSDTGGFVSSWDYKVMPANTMAERAAVVRAAVDLVDAALEWCAVVNVRHSARDWNQSPMYFAIDAAQSLFPWRFKTRKGETLSLRTNNRRAQQITREIAFQKES